MWAVRKKILNALGDCFAEVFPLNKLVAVQVLDGSTKDVSHVIRFSSRRKLH